VNHFRPEVLEVQVNMILLGADTAAIRAEIEEETVKGVRKLA